ncbi:sulfite exporter TauE/SafE family protein [Bacillus sp. PS06]|uniref:sulfite exporter TauE/SafE family protein n=1 Tax=Bacillus sp. PS06 TaxID=2764176 RepID=UPI0017824CBB|nr:sulfite exporter TauE/SafE family protein [Bacillus sp. PS06]MBD8071057.1 sulfite exporter TauE/SafE family protein [Bacillus sp. PS06]
MPEIILYLSLGLGIGILSGFFGIGGGFILTPILLLLAFNPVIAIATSLLYTIATSLSGSFAHYRLHHIKWKPAILIGISGIIATQFAHPFVLYIERLQIEDTVVPILYILLICYFSISLLRRQKEQILASTIEKNTRVQVISKTILIGFFAGFISATLGVGGGFIIVPLLISVLSFTPKYAVGTSLFSVLLIVTAGFASYAFNTPLNYEISGILIIGAIFGGQIGSLFTKGYSNKQIRTFLAGLYIATGISLVLDLFKQDLVGLMTLSIYCLFLLIHFSMHSIRKRNVMKENQTP